MAVRNAGQMPVIVIVIVIVTIALNQLPAQPTKPLLISACALRKPLIRPIQRNRGGAIEYGAALAYDRLMKFL